MLDFGGPKIRDAAALVSMAVGIGVVFSSIGGYFLIQDHIKSNMESIRELEHWRYEHENTATQRNLLIIELKERVDACCPLYKGKN